MTQKKTRLSFLLAVVLTLPNVAIAQKAVAEHPDFSGFWNMDPKETTRTPTGNFDEGYVPQAQLTPEAEARRKAAAANARDPNAVPTGNIVGDGSRWCIPLSFPFFYRSAEGFSIIQGRNEIAIAAERPMNTRHIYMDQKSHPANWEPTIMGHSIGWWDGDVLVVDSVGFAHGAIPNAGPVTPKTHLVERFQLLSDGRLSVKFAWDDPTFLAKTDSYEFFYVRMAPDTYSVEDICDASDPAQYNEPFKPYVAPSPK